MKKQFVICFLILALLLSGCAGQKPDVSLEASPSSSAGEPTGTVKPEPSGTGATASSDPATDPTDPSATGDPTASGPATATEAPGTDPSQAQRPTEDQPKPTEGQPEPTGAPKPTQASKPTEAQPKPTEAPKPTEGHTHSYNAQTVAPTCTEQGYTLHRCSCGASYKDSYTNATGHSYDSGRVTTAASCSAEGVKTYICTKCGATKTEAIAKTSHSYVETVVAPTYSAGGYTQHTCSVCGYSCTDSETDQLVFDIDYWVEYAKDTAREMGFIVEEVPEGANSEVPGGWGGWDTPIMAYPLMADQGLIEESINQRLTRYKSRGITSIWVWTQPNPYTDKRAGWYIYIAYA